MFNVSFHVAIFRCSREHKMEIFVYNAIVEHRHFIVILKLFLFIVIREIYVN